jgi:aspartate carbamoyltransferase catalytic subunit
MENKQFDTLKDRILATLFFEASTRTRLSFETAMHRLGGKVLGFGSKEGTSVVKGESLTDTVRVIEKYSDCILIRHQLEGSARLAAEVSNVPVINGGDGGNQHPTQTLLDLYTIKKIRGSIEKQRIVLLGDLKHARTMRSLYYALCMYGAEVILCSPPELRMSRETIQEARTRFGATVQETSDVKKSLENADVVYVCRIQKERFEDELEARRMQREFRVTPELLPENIAILHPLPRVNEIAHSVDEMSGAKYFEQAGNGVPVRMAVLKKVMAWKT